MRGGLLRSRGKGGGRQRQRALAHIEGRGVHRMGDRPAPRADIRIQMHSPVAAQ